MSHDERVALIQAGILKPGGIWADFGAGAGAFTTALRTCVGENATIYAVDRDARVLQRQQRDVHIVQADLTQTVQQLPPLDGILIANALHFIRWQRSAIETLIAQIKPCGALIVVEYDVTRPRPYIPHPLGRERCQALMRAAGLHKVAVVGERVSPSSGIAMTAIRGLRPTEN